MKPDPPIEIVACMFDGASKRWHAEIGGLLAQAAIMAVEHDLNVATFMATAWTAYAEARPRAVAKTRPR